MYRQRLIEVSMSRMVQFRENEQVVREIDGIAKNKGIDRSSFIRMAIREKMAAEH